MKKERPETERDQRDTRNDKTHEKTNEEKGEMRRERRKEKRDNKSHGSYLRWLVLIHHHHSSLGVYSSCFPFMGGWSDDHQSADGVLRKKKDKTAVNSG